ncbi:hypothetical protein Pfo_011199 [Paulownia fortunei]|nr:hypothetical protein Pfo_011199 [Paulownia fortunei]
MGETGSAVMPTENLVCGYLQPHTVEVLEEPSVTNSHSGGANLGKRILPAIFVVYLVEMVELMAPFYASLIIDGFAILFNHTYLESIHDFGWIVFLNGGCYGYVEAHKTNIVEKNIQGDIQKEKESFSGINNVSGRGKSKVRTQFANYIKNVDSVEQVKSELEVYLEEGVKIGCELVMESREKQNSRALVKFVVMELDVCYYRRS